MKYLFTILFLVVMYPGLGQAGPRFEGGPRQHNPNANPNRFNRPLREAKIADKIKRAQEFKVAFLTRQLELSPAQNDKFWPLYKQFQQELNAAQIERRENNLNPQPNSQDKIDELDIKITNIRMRYRAEFRKILPPDKVMQLYKSEQEFNDEAVKRLRGEKKDDASN